MGGYQHRVLPLRRQFPVPRHDRPSVGQQARFRPALVQHGLHRKGHPLAQGHAGAGFPIVQYVGRLVKHAAYAVAAVFAHHAQALRFGQRLDGMADIAQPLAGRDLAEDEILPFVFDKLLDKK